MLLKCITVAILFIKLTEALHSGRSMLPKYITVAFLFIKLTEASRSVKPASLKSFVNQKFRKNYQFQNDQFPFIEVYTELTFSAICTEPLLWLYSNQHHRIKLMEALHSERSMPTKCITVAFYIIKFTEA